jgi:hypothetical protein
VANIIVLTVKAFSISKIVAIASDSCREKLSELSLKTSRAGPPF